MKPDSMKYPIAPGEGCMTIQTVQDDNATQSQPVRSWLVSLVGFLLVSEAIFLMVLFPALILLRLWQLPDFSPSQLLPLQQTLQTFRLQLITTPELALQARWATGELQLLPGHAPALIYPFLGVTLLPVSLFFWRGKRYGWTLAVLIQGASLAIALATYFRYEPFYTYLLLFVCAMMAFSLNFHGVKTAFFPLEAVTKVTEPELEG